ncbi:MAG TPA: hypothetical protein VF631_13990 [Allosphingosinicella sp.]
MTDRRAVRRKIALGLLTACGIYQIALGLYFILCRPSFLPEDVRFMRGSAAAIRAAAPGIEAWLQWVFAVMGGQMTGVGILVLLAARRERYGIAAPPAETFFLASAAVATAVLMSGVNFAIGSDFRWLLLAPVALWILALFFHSGGRPHEDR